MKIIRQQKGQPIMEWIYAGPFKRNVSDLYEDNYHVPVEPYEPFIHSAKEKMSHFVKSPTEGESLSLFDQSKSWTYLRTNETDKKVIWADFGTFARMMVTYAANEIIAPESKVYRFRIQFTGSLIIKINGVDVLDRRQAGRVEGEETCEIPLRKGRNTCILLLANVHLHCVNSFSLIPEEEGLQIGVSLEPASELDRLKLEEDFEQFYLENDIFQKEADISVYIRNPVATYGDYLFTICKSPNGFDMDETVCLSKCIPIEASRTEKIILCRCGELPGISRYKARYNIHIDYILKNGTHIKGRCLSFYPVSFMDMADNMAGGDHAKRRIFLLNRYAQMPNEEIRNGIYHELAKFEIGADERIDLKTIERSIEYINQRYDCADFAIHGLLRMYYKYHQSGQLPSGLLGKMKKCILGFKYWEDEPGKSMMFTRSENHEILFYSAEYLAGLLFPLENFTNSNQNGLFHVLKGKMNAERWMKEKGTYGFTEWHSNCYYEEDMLALLNIYDFGEENSYTRKLAKNLLDLICLITASHSYRGILATTHGRSYERMILHPELEGMSHLNWLMFGLPEKLEEHLSIGAVALAGSNYVPPAEFLALANSKEEIYTVSRMGLFFHKGEAGVNCATYRTKDYMVSGLVESQKGEFGHQVHVGQVILDRGIPIFVTCFDNQSEHTRPSYWGGQYRNPKTIAYKNLLVYICKIEDVVGYTHCYFPFHQFDSVEKRNKWLFGCINKSYVALYSKKPYIRVKEGTFKDRELLCMDKDNIWLIEMGNQEKWRSFNSFIHAVENAQLDEEGEDIIYHSPSIGMMELGWDRVCCINQQPILDKPFPLIQNDFCYGDYGTGMIRYKAADKEKILFF